MEAQVLWRFCTARQGVASSPGSALMDMSPGCNPLFLLLLLGAPSSSKSSSLIGAAFCCALLRGWFLACSSTPCSTTLHSPDPPSVAELLSAFNPSFHVSTTFFSQYRTELSVARFFSSFFFALFTEPSSACWENGFGWILISAPKLKETVYILSYCFFFVFFIYMWTRAALSHLLCFL